MAKLTQNNPNYAHYITRSFVIHVLPTNIQTRRTEDVQHILEFSSYLVTLACPLRK